MRTTTFARILDGIARIYGEETLTAKDAATVAASLDNDRCEELFSHADWRELDVIEERFFEADYLADATYSIDDVVYYSSLDRYYRCTAATSGNLPTDEDFWTVATGIPKVVNFVQAGKTPIGTVNAVTLHDPRLQPASANVPFVRREGALQVVGVTQTSVWVRFTRRVPRFTSAAYAAGTTYGLGDVVYDATTGLCYESLDAANMGNAVTDASKWQAQEIPYFGQRFLIRAGLADLYESQSKEDKAARQESKAALALSDAYHAQTLREGQFTRMEVLGGQSTYQDEPNLAARTIDTNDGNALIAE